MSKCALLFPHSLTIKPQTLNISSLALLCTHFPCWVPGGSDGEVSTYSAGDRGSIPGLGRSPGGGNGNPLQYSCLENPMDCSLPGSSVHGVAKSRTRLSDWATITNRTQVSAQSNSWLHLDNKRNFKNTHLTSHFPAKNSPVTPRYLILVITIKAPFFTHFTHISHTFHFVHQPSM